MKNTVFIWTVGLVVNFTLLGLAQAEEEKIPISVQKFEDKSAGSNCRYDWDWWHNNLGGAFADILIDELGKNEKYEVLERENIKAIFEDEVNLLNSEGSETVIEKGKFEKAKYTIVGTVTEFEYCVGKGQSNVNISQIASLFGKSLPSMDVGYSEAKTHVQVTLRVIDVKTGKVVRSVRGEDRQTDSRVSLDTDFVSLDDQKTSPIGKTIRGAIASGVSKLQL